MKSLVNQFVKTFENNEEFQRRLDAYDRILKTEDWMFVKDVLITIKGTMMSDMFSAKFTNLDKEEKDVLQKTYFNINKFLIFCLNHGNG